MRLFSQYTFTVGNTEFFGIFALVEGFLQQQGLHYDQLCCELRDTVIDPTLRIAIAKDKRIIQNRKSAVVYGLTDLLRDHPHFFYCGQLTKMNTSSQPNDSLVWSDMDAYGIPMDVDSQAGNTRELANMFPAPYCLESILFSYVNIDFFHRKSEPVPEKSDANDYKRLFRKGCHISFLKETIFCRAPKLVMTIDVTGEHGVLDAEPYAKALSTVLGKKYTAVSVLSFTKEERLALEQRKMNVQPMVDVAAKALLKEAARFGQIKPIGQRNLQDVLFKAGKNIKTIARSFGFDRYQYDPSHVHYLSASTAGAHTLTMVVDAPPRWNEIRFSVCLSGLGFKYRLPLASVYCESQEEADRCLRTAFEITQELSKTVFRSIFEEYEKTPDWYTPDVT